MDNGTITFLNAVGAVLQWSYVLLYLIFIEDKVICYHGSIPVFLLSKSNFQYTPNFKA